MMASCPTSLLSPLSLERPACVRELIAAVGDAATFSVAGRSVVLQQGYDNSAYSLVLPSCCGRVAAYCSMIGALHFRRGRRFARAASSLLLLLLAYGACFGRATMLGRVHRTRQHLVLESPSGSSTSLSSMLRIGSIVVVIAVAALAPPVTVVAAFDKPLLSSPPLPQNT